VVCFVGDVASSDGRFHEALSRASVVNLPVLFACVNSQYGMSMHVRRSRHREDIPVRAASQGMPGRSVDGNDTAAVSTAARECRAAVQDRGPLLLVLNAYRILGHSKIDVGLYRRKSLDHGTSPVTGAIYLA
jgi:TPP-dependent pyruvate/acetoin dehydrogenase alpha subunit